MLPASQLIPLVPELFLVLVTIGLLLLGVLRSENAVKMLVPLSLLTLFFTLLLLMNVDLARAVVMHGMFVSDGFAVFTKILVVLAALLLLALSNDWQLRGAAHSFEFPILILLSTVGLMFLISANDLMAFYMGLELSSLALYVLAAFNRDSLKSTEAGLKYFVLGALASGMMLFGASLVYGFAGTTNFSALAALFSGQVVDARAAGLPLDVSLGLVVGLVLVIIGFCFKMSAAPFHMWTPDVYEGAPTPVTAFFSVAPKVAIIAVFARVLMQPFGDLVMQWQQVLMFVSVASMAVGAFGAITQTNIKRLLAYSSIGHVGYALIGLAAGTASGITGVLVYITLYVFMSLGAFACVMLMRRKGEAVEDISELSGLSRVYPRRAFALAVFMFSMAGIPPLAGFFGKMYIFLAAVQGGLITLAVIGVLASVVSCYYYLKVVKVMYFDEAREMFDSEVPLGLKTVLAVCVLVNLLFFIAPSGLVNAARVAAEALLF